MQKKIYSLLIVPCLALCLALGFLVSCGDTGGGATPAPDPGTGSNVDKENPCITDPSSCDPTIEIKVNPNNDIIFTGDYELKITGSIELSIDPTLGLYIQSVSVILLNPDGQNKQAVLSNANGDLTMNYDLNIPPFDLKPCDWGKYDKELVIQVSASNGKYNEARFSVPASPHSTCAAYTLTTKVEPAGAGSVQPSSGTYSYNQSVTLTATSANSEYDFSRWKDRHGNILGTSPSYTFNITDDQEITAVFVGGSWGLVKAETIKAENGVGVKLGGVEGAIKYNYTSSILESGNGAQLMNTFQIAGGGTGQLYDQIIENPTRTSQFLTEGISPVPSTDYELGQYFVVKTGNDKSGWFLLMVTDPTDDCKTVMPKPCLVLDLWKAQ